MKLITDLKQNCLEPASVALGCFDGIHLGHQAVIGCAVADKPNGLTPSVFTFQENPLQVLTGNTVPTLLAPDTRNQIFEEIGVEQVFMPSFREVMNLEARFKVNKGWSKALLLFLCLYASSLFDINQQNSLFSIIRFFWRNLKS